MMGHGIYKVERKVDTVIVEMDVDVAEQLVAVLGQVISDTVHAKTVGHQPLNVLFNKLIDDAEVRHPSRLYRGVVDDSPVYGKAFYLRNTPETGG